MLLEQINRRLAALAAEVKKKGTTKMREAPPPGSHKTIGVKADAETYEKLVAFMKREGIKSVKVAALEAMKRGLA